MNKSHAKPGTARALKKLRRKIDRADRRLLGALGARFRTVREIGRIKIAQGLPLLQKARWSEVMAERLKIARRLGLREELVEGIYLLIHREALEAQQALAAKQGKKKKKRKS